MRVNFTPRGLDEDINTPHQKIAERLTLTEYSEFKSISKVYDFAEKHYEKAQELEPGLSGKKPASQTRKPRRKAIPELESGISGFDPDAQEDMEEDSPHKVYRKFDKKGVELPLVLQLTEEEYMKEHERAVDKLMQSASISNGDPNLKPYDTIMRTLLSMMDHRGYINDYLTIDQNRKTLEFDKSELKRDALYVKKEKEHKKQIEQDYKVISGEMDSMELDKPSQEILRDINAMTDFAVNNNGNNVSEMNKEQKRFFTDILKPMEQKISKHENKGMDLRKPDGSLDPNKLGQLYVETKKQAIDKHQKKAKRKENTLSM
ncbi:hypothetical protein [Billgrantia endophytica]|uniref:Uncharacterized protein n=1 Tax=Billgrantia endophytica TaxID=2033802 RepID=A0A2N7TUC8_9GAMM|nr:hypothetical protein [Halomonas endophytica]PMR71776.1 hypothetical protein C1H69_22855 [Halomonas endophytica]